MQIDSQTNVINPQHWLRNYLPMWIGQAVSLLGSGLVQFALVWYLTKQTGSAAVLATANLVALLPGVFLGPFSGALVDRWNRKATMIISDLAVALATLALVFLFAVDLIQIWHIYVALFIRSLCGTFQHPAMSASTTLMVPPEKFTKLGGINQALHGVISIVSPPLGALLLELLPMQGVLAVDIITAGLAIALLILLVRVPEPDRTDKVELVTPKVVLRDVKEGFRYAISWRGLFLLLLSAALLNMLIGPGFSLMPLLITNHFMKGAAELAWMDSAVGIGLVLGGLALGVWGGFKRKIITSMSGIIGMGVCILTLGLTPKTGYLLAVVMMGVVGFMSSMANGPLGALLQAKVPPDKQARIFAVVNSMTGAASPIGMILAAPIAELLGIQAWYLVAGSMCLIIGVFGMFYRPIATLDIQEAGGIIPEPVPTIE